MYRDRVDIYIQRMIRCVIFYLISSFLFPFSLTAQDLGSSQAILPSAPYPSRCNMGSCFWVWLLSSHEINTGSARGKLKVVRYKTGNSIDYFYSEDGNTKIKPSSEVEWGDGNETVHWRPGISHGFVFCSTERPTYFHDPEDIRPFEFPIVRMYELSAVRMYFRVCHGIDYQDTDGFFQNFGYPHEEPEDQLHSNHRSTQYQSINDLLE